MESHWEVKKGEFALKYVNPPHGGKHISNTSLATGRTNADYTSSRLFYQHVHFPLCSHKRKIPDLSRREFQLGEIILLPSIVRAVLVKPGTSERLESQGNYTHKEIVFAMGQVHSSFSKDVHCPHFLAGSSLVGLRYYWRPGFPSAVSSDIFRTYVCVIATLCRN